MTPWIKCLLSNSEDLSLGSSTNLKFELGIDWRGRSQGWLTGQPVETSSSGLWETHLTCQHLTFICNMQASIATHTHIPTHMYVLYLFVCFFVLPWWIEPRIHSCRQAQYYWAAFLAQFNFWLAYNNLYSFMGYSVVFLYIHTARYDQLKVVKHIYGLKHLLFLNHSKSFIAILKYTLLNWL